MPLRPKRLTTSRTVRTIAAGGDACQGLLRPLPRLKALVSFAEVRLSHRKLSSGAERRGTAPRIDLTDIADLRLFDRYWAEPGTGLHLHIHPGRAIAGGTLRYHSAATSLLPPTATTCLWQRASGA
jgi:hypothetical protein